ncbi:AAA family ATPase, partial [bacterium]|nr:AAA family ATPase [bacterium]
MENFSPIIILESNINSQKIIKSYLEELNYNGTIELFSDYAKGVEAIKTHNNPIVFMNISVNDENSDEIISSVKLLTSKIVITSTDYSTNMIIKAMRLGAKEFLPKPILKEDLARVISILNAEGYSSESSASKIITVFSNKGGIGKTTLATNLAVELAKTTKDKVALIDLNLQLGDISTFLGLSPTFDVSYVMKKLASQQDETMLQVLEQYNNTGLYVLSDPSYIERSESITTYHIENLFKILKQNFPYIVVDMSSNIDANSLKILDDSDIILFTTIVNIPAIRNAQRCLSLFKSRRYSHEKVKLVINRYMDSDEIKIEDIESTLGEKVYWKIP